MIAPSQISYKVFGLPISSFSIFFPCSSLLSLKCPSGLNLTCNAIPCCFIVPNCLEKLSPPSNASGSFGLISDSICTPFATTNRKTELVLTMAFFATMSSSSSSSSSSSIVLASSSAATFNRTLCPTCGPDVARICSTFFLSFGIKRTKRVVVVFVVASISASSISTITVAMSGRALSFPRCALRHDDDEYDDDDSLRRSALCVMFAFAFVSNFPLF